MRFYQASLAFKEMTGSKYERPIVLGPVPVSLIQKLDLVIKS
jgi:hypothetical protein